MNPQQLAMQQQYLLQQQQQQQLRQQQQTPASQQQQLQLLKQQQQVSQRQQQQQMAPQQSQYIHQQHAQRQIHPSAAAAATGAAAPYKQAHQQQAPPAYINRPDNYASLVSQIQFINGDAEKPQENTVRVIEQYVRQKMMKMIIRARENMFQRVGFSQAEHQNQLTLDDFTFLNRHRTEKLTRLHTYLSIKRYEAREKEKTTFELQIDRHCLHRGHLDRLERILTNTEDQLPEEKTTEKPPRNMFLIRDSVDEKRAKGAKKLVRDMNQSEFNQYSKCGGAVFKFSQDQNKFLHWLRLDEIRYSLQKDLLQCLSYLAYEMVALVTQVSLLVKRNTELNREDDTSKTISVVTGALDDDWKSRLSTVHLEGDASYEKAPSTRRPIQPGHVFEAIRRLEARDELFSKHYEFL